jgi:tetratricopeptide (TPR) repeat protein
MESISDVLTSEDNVLPSLPQISLYMKNLWLFLGSISALLILLIGCAKQTKATKPYHDLTGRYNAYYNATLRLEESFVSLNKQYQDNYNKLLHLYPYAAVENVASVKQPLDEAITKSSRNIMLHEIGDWTDNSYLLMGKAEFLQQEYDRAANTFKYIYDKYHPEAVEGKKKETTSKKKPTAKKKKKKKRRRRKVRRKRVSRKKVAQRKKKAAKQKAKANKANEQDEGSEEDPEKPINYGLKHRPVRHEATLWLAKTHIELGQFDEAGYYLRVLENDLTVPYNLRPQIQAVVAYSWIQQKEYTKAIEPLELAIADTKGQKDIKNRYVYLLAQLQQQQGDNAAAMENFKRVLRLKPSYEMEFNARLNMAKNAAQSSGRQRIDPEMALRRMLRDSKNEEYKDQIYFALAEIQLSKGNKQAGILALQQSMYNSSNPAQRAEGALLLAELFYERDAFVKAYAYYDTTTQEMNKKDERYAATDTRKRRLEGLARHLSEKAERDSLLIVASWPRARQERWAVTGLEREENRAALGESFESDSRGGGIGNMQRRPIGAVEEGVGRGVRQQPSRGPSGQVKVSEVALQRSKFALYNPTIKKKGEREFQKRWESRSWVDDWRRSNKEESQTVDDTNIAEAAPKTQAEIDGYLKRRGVPGSDQERASMKDKLGEALFFAARHYREDLRRSDKALELVNELVDEHPKSPYTVEALFLAYNIYSEQGNSSKANYYKAQILNNYPTSNIAKVLSDPNFANAEKEKYARINKYYDETYALMRKGNAQQALERVRAVSTQFGEDYEMKRRFALLEAMCIGGVNGEKDYVRALRSVVTSYPETEESDQARQMIAFLKGDNNSRSRTNNNNTANNPNRGELYKVTPNSKHLVLVVFDDVKTRTNQYRAPITNFNNKYYLNKRLSTSSILVDGKTPSLTIRGAFNNAEEAMAYVLDITTNKEFLQGVSGYRVYAISKENYAIAMTKQKFVLYDAFFKKNYE